MPPSGPTDGVHLFHNLSISKKEVPGFLEVVCFDARLVTEVQTGRRLYLSMIRSYHLKNLVKSCLSTAAGVCVLYLCQKRRCMKNQGLKLESSRKGLSDRAFVSTW